VLDRLGLGDAPSRGEAAAGVEFVLEGLHLTRRLAKDVTDDGRTVYGSRATEGGGRGGRGSDGGRR
jgi:magnesium chelatase subunit I